MVYFSSHPRSCGKNDRSMLFVIEAQCHVELTKTFKESGTRADLTTTVSK